MNQNELWPVLALVLLGAYHGINPGMGWLFAVALGMQEKSGRAVWRSLVPIGAGHALAIGAVVFLASLAGLALPLSSLKIAVAAILFVMGIYRLIGHRHPRFGGMQVGFRDLTIWSFLMASAHGAGLMVLPVLMEMPAASHTGSGHAVGHHAHGAIAGSAAGNLLAVAVHTAGYLAVTGLVAWIVYARLGLALLREAWVNLDMIWSMALVLTGCFVLFL
ncbi:MAG TPA: hypothetical protein VFC10_00210 [Terriglobia bacterium]|nr:hypothetical protein [Terriglobia bacterium]